MIPVYSPRIFTESAIQALNSGWISSQGEYIQRTCDKLSEVLKIPYVVLMNNGTSATHMLIKALNYKYPTLNKIYVPNHVFVAVWNSVLYDFAKECMEVLETDPKTLNMRTDEDYIQNLQRNSAVMIVHNIGNIINVPRLKRLRPDLIFVEDNCEGLFGIYEGVYSGTSPSSLCSSASFFANKTITSGEGGAFFTHDKDLYTFIYNTIHHGLSDRRYVFGMLGYNYRMTNIEAALLYDQLVHLDGIRMDKKHVFDEYTRQLGDSVVLPVCEHETISSQWMFVCGLRNVDYSDFEKHMRTQGVDTRPFFYDIQVHQHLADIPRIPLVDDVTYFMLPSYPDLTQEQIDSVCRAVLTYKLSRE